MSRGVAINSHTNHIIRANKKHAVLNPVMEKKDGEILCNKQHVQERNCCRKVH